MLYRKLMLLGALAAAAADAQPRSPAERWISSNAIPLKTVEAGHGFEDMQTLKKVVGDARIVSLGEATHGTREFFQLKHRMLEFLATEMGFTLFSIEANMPEAYRLNDYVLKGEGDPAALLKGLYYWTWDTQEVLDMIRWMREFNKSGKGPVQFTGFDMSYPRVSAESVRAFVEKADPDYSSAIRKAVEMSRQEGVSSPGFATATGKFPLEEARGKKLRFSGWIKTRDADGSAGLWWRVDGRSGTLGFNNMADQAIKGTTDWKQYSFELPVAAGATNINFGVLLSGGGAAWFDDLTVELDGKIYQDPQFDFSFESPSLKGLGNYSPEYSIALDSTTSHGGKQSLQLRRTAPLPGPDTGGPKDAAAHWKEVVQHLEGSRGRYTSKAEPREIEWVIQNARVVEQRMRWRANLTTRDKSMAESVRWILDQNPKAKIVLWAHNGHVNASAAYGIKPMGGFLRDWYGGEMVVFGFAFGEGSFQAYLQNHGLRNFTVPPLPEATLDTALATGGSLFALDLRTVPVTGEAAGWFRQPQTTRWIGAVYSEEGPLANYLHKMDVLSSFDAMLFVGKTSPARKNP